MEFLTITQAEKDAVIAEAVVMRERELLGYETNLAHYRQILANLPADEWPEDIAKYKGGNPHRLAVVLDDATMDRVSLYLYRDQIRTLIRTEQIEMRKSMALYDTAKAALPADRTSRDSLLTAAKTKLTAPA